MVLLRDMLLPVEESLRVMHKLRLFQLLREAIHPTVRLEHLLTLEVAILVTEQNVAKAMGMNPRQYVVDIEETQGMTVN